MLIDLDKLAATSLKRVDKSCVLGQICGSTGNHQDDYDAIKKICPALYNVRDQIYELNISLYNAIAAERKDRQDYCKRELVTLCREQGVEIKFTGGLQA